MFTLPSPKKGAPAYLRSVPDEFFERGLYLGKGLASGVLHSLWGVLFGEALTRTVLPAGGVVKKNNQKNNQC